MRASRAGCARAYRGWRARRSTATGWGLCRRRGSQAADLTLAWLAREEHLIGQPLLDNLAIQRRGLQQVLVIAVRDHATVIEHNDLVCERDRRQAVRDHERRAPGHRLVERE